MVHVEPVRDLMRDGRAADVRGRADQPPAVADGAAPGRTGAPAALGVLDPDRRGAHGEAGEDEGEEKGDLPLEESGPWREVADAAGIANILLAAPTAPDERLPRICEAARGFVYAVSLLGVTGERQSLATTAVGMATRLKAVTDRPVLIGIGISNAEQAVEACTVADGVIMASALMRMRLDGASVQQVADAALLVRKAIDG